MNGNSLSLQDQKELITLIEKYDNTPSKTIKENLIKYIDNSQYYRDSVLLAEKAGLNVQTIYLYRQPNKKSNISFTIALKLCDILGITINELMT